jgi:DDE superfamily endonuclease
LRPIGSPTLTVQQIGPLFGVSHSAAHRVFDTIGPLLALAPVRNAVLIRSR